VQRMRLILPGEFMMGSPQMNRVEVMLKSYMQ